MRNKWDSTVESSTFRMRREWVLKEQQPLVFIAVGKLETGWLTDSCPDICTLGPLYSFQTPDPDSFVSRLSSSSCFAIWIASLLFRTGKSQWHSLSEEASRKIGYDDHHQYPFVSLFHFRAAGQAFFYRKGVLQKSIHLTTSLSHSSSPSVRVYEWVESLVLVWEKDEARRAPWTEWMTRGWAKKRGQSSCSMWWPFLRHLKVHRMMLLQ